MASKSKKEVYFVLIVIVLLYDSETCFVMKDETVCSSVRANVCQARLNSITELSGQSAWLGGGDPNISGKWSAVQLFCGCLQIFCSIHLRRMLRFVQAPKIPTLRAGPIESAISSREEEERDADTKKSSVIIIYHAIITIVCCLLLQVLICEEQFDERPEAPSGELV